MYIYTRTPTYASLHPCPLSYVPPPPLGWAPAHRVPFPQAWRQVVCCRSRCTAPRHAHPWPAGRLRGGQGQGRDPTPGRRPGRPAADRGGLGRRGVSSTAPVLCARSCVCHRPAWCVAMLVPQDVGGGESAGMLGGGRWKGEGWRWLPFASPSSQPSSFASSSSILFFF
jgi:hypothetical protein